MHRNVARAYDCLQDEHDRIRVACIKLLTRSQRPRTPATGVHALAVQGITTKCFFMRSVNGSAVDQSGLKP
jgi:hypothetical protein